MATCKKCGKNYKVLAKELCAYCYKKENKEWPKEFLDTNQKRK